MQVVLVYLQALWCNLLLKCVSQPEITKKFTKPPILGVQGNSRSSMLTFLRSSSPVLVMISSTSVPICNHFRVRRANNAFLRGYPFFPLVRGIPSPSGMKFCHEILDTRGYHMVKTQSLYLTWSWNSTGTWHQDGQTDRRTDRQNYRN